MRSRDTTRVPGPNLRVILALVTVLATVQFALAIFAYLQFSRDADGKFRLPLPNRVAAMVEIVEAADPALTDPLMLALSASDFEVLIVALLPEDDDRERYPLPGVERAVGRYVESLPGRQVEAWLVPPEGTGTELRFRPTRLYSNAPMRLGVSLADGGWLLVTTQERLAQRVFGFPPGFWAGAIGVLVASLALFALCRGLGPLNRLARTVEAFGHDPAPRPVPERGTREVRQVTRSTNAMQARIAELIEERAVAHAALSHDLRTYLARLALRVDAIPDETSKTKAHTEIERMSALVESSLTLVRLDGTSDDVSMGPVDIVRVVEEAVERHNAPVCRADIGDAEVMVRGNRTLLMRAVENLVANAERHAGGGEIVVKRIGETVSVGVLDRGPGLDPLQVERLLKPFERGDRARTLDVPGSGLGLAIVARIARAHGGTFSLDPRSGGGLAASLVFPTAPG